MAGNRWRLAQLGAGLIAIAACTPSPEKLLDEARAALAAGELRTAEIHVKNLLQRQPDNAAARLLLGNVSLLRGDPLAAEQGLRRALQLGADPGAVEIPLVTALLQQRKFSEALEQIASGSAVTGADRVALLRLEAAAHRGLRAYGQAEAAYRSALELEPGSPGLRVELAALLLEAGRAGDARDLVIAVLADEPAFVPALLLRGTFESAARQFDAAEATFQQIADLEHGSGPRSPSYVLARAQLIEAQLALRKIDAAAANADGLLAADPRSPIGRYMKAAVEVEHKELDEAERRLEDLIADVPDYWQAHRLLGVINLAQNQLGHALMYLRAAVNNDPADGIARLKLAELYIRQGDLDAARKLVEAGGVNGPVANPADPVVNFALGSIALEKGQQDEATRRFEAVLAARPNHAPTLNNLAWLYDERGDARALDFAERAYALEPANPSIADTLGWLYVKRGDASRALPLLATAAAGLPDHAEVRYHWGVALAETGDHTKALEVLQAALAAGQFAGRNDVVKRVAELQAARP